MRKIAEGRETRLPSAHLYLDDLEAIFETLARTCKSVSLRDETHEFESIEELVRHRGEYIRRLEFTGSLPSFSLWITRSLVGNRLFASGETSAAAAFLETVEVFRKRASIVSRVLPPGVDLFARIIVVTGAIPIGIAGGAGRLDMRLAITLLILLIAVSGASYAAQCGVFNSICLRRSHEASSLFFRKREDIFVATIAAALGALVTWFVGKFF